jgi:hypothetical protein
MFSRPHVCTAAFIGSGSKIGSNRNRMRCAILGGTAQIGCSAINKIE